MMCLCNGSRIGQLFSCDTEAGMIHFINAPSQWEMTLHYDVSHWLGAYTKWSPLMFFLQPIGKVPECASSHVSGKEISLHHQRPGGRFKNTYDLLNLGALNFHPSINYISFNVWVRYFVWNFKGYLWNSTRNILPILWKMWYVDNLWAIRFKTS